ncbi:MAG: hypothetical protein ACR2L2_03985 [Acidobacteriota bacterium]
MTTQLSPEDYPHLLEAMGHVMTASAEGNFGGVYELARGSTGESEPAAILASRLPHDYSRQRRLASPELRTVRKTLDSLVEALRDKWN